MISILYRNIDNFLASKYLLNIKNHLKSQGLQLTKESVENNYFLFLNALYYPNLITDKLNNKIKLKTDNIYIDVIEQCTTIIKNNKIIKNDMYGEIIYKDDRQISMDVTLPGSIENIMSIHKIKLLDYKDFTVENHKILQINYIKGKQTLLMYNRRNIEEQILFLERKDDFYTFTTKTDVIFKTIRIKIPVPNTSYNVKIKSKIGTAELNRKEMVVEWKATNISILDETIYVSPEMFERVEDLRPITVDFVIDNYKNSIARINRCEAIFNGDARIWVKYLTQAKIYEFRK